MAICQPGAFRDGIPVGQGGIFNGALGGGTCIRPISGNGPVYFTQWDSNFKMRNSMAMLRMCYASAIESDGTISTFSLMASNARGNALAPLAQFGFTDTC